MQWLVVGWIGIQAGGTFASTEFIGVGARL